MILRTDETDLGSSQEAFPGDVKFIGANHNPPSHIPSNSNTRCLLLVFLHSEICDSSRQIFAQRGLWNFLELVSDQGTGWVFLYKENYGSPPTILKLNELNWNVPSLKEESFNHVLKRIFRNCFQSPKMEASPIFLLRASISPSAGFSGFCEAARKIAGNSLTSPTDLRKSPLWESNQ